MSNPVEKSLFVVFLAGVLATLYLINDAGPSPQPAEGLSPESTIPSTPDPTLVDLDRSDPVAIEQPEEPEDTLHSHLDDPDPDNGPAPDHDHDHEITTTTLIYTSTGSVEEDDQEEDDQEEDDPSVPTAEDRQVVRCAPIEELWPGDSHPVEDPCTLAEVRRTLYLAYTGTDEQRRSVIRNGHLLDEVFAALDDFGRTHDAALFDPERRGQTEVIYEGITWRGGLEADQGVIAVLFRLNHPDFEPTDSLLDTLVQVDGRWKLSYRRSYCVKVVVIMELLGNEVRCPVDPNPEVNEDEAPSSTGRYR